MTVYDPPKAQNDPRVCGSCRRTWACGTLNPPQGFSILNTRTGRYHNNSRTGTETTDCGRDATGDEWLWPA